jgi:hypothetical protein
MPTLMEILLPWYSGIRWFSEKRKGPVYRVELRTDWQGRYKAALISDDRGDLVGELADRAALLSGGAVELPSGASFEVQVTAQFAGDDVETRIDSREPVWRQAPLADVADVASLVRRAAIFDLAAGALFFALGLVLVWAAIATANERGLFVGALGGLAGLGAWRLLREGLDLAKGPGSSVARALGAERSPIGWIHGRVRAGRMSLVVHFLDGESRSFEVPRHRWDGVFALFGAQAPEAAQGYSPEAAARYESMRKRRRTGERKAKRKAPEDGGEHGE